MALLQYILYEVGYILMYKYDFLPSFLFYQKRPIRIHSNETEVKKAESIVFTQQRLTVD